jgi:hypothetical protein
MKELIAVTQARYHSGHRLRLQFSDGREKSLTSLRGFAAKFSNLSAT